MSAYFALIIDNDNGTDIELFKTAELADETVNNYVRAHWRFQFFNFPMPASINDAVEYYFLYSDDWYKIEEVNVRIFPSDFT